MAAAQRISLEKDSRLGVYRVVRLLGSGAMGAVYEAVHTLLNKRVAIKLMHADLSGRQDLHDRFLREGRAAVAIQHPHVVQVSDVGFHEGLPYLVMDFLEGTDLRAALQQRGRFPVGEACDLLLPVVAAVAAAHEAGVIHRDLKPDNVFLVRPSRRDRPGVVPKVVDFGISKLNDGGAKTATQTIMGSPAYMSPEQCNGRTGPESDQWALGVMIYELCTGQLPFEAESQMALMFKICVGAPEPAGRHAVTLPAVLEGIIARALHKDPAGRFPSVRALGAALLPLCSAAVVERHAHELTLTDDAPRTHTEVGRPAPEGGEGASAAPEPSAAAPPAAPPRATPVATTLVVPQLVEAPAALHPRDTLTPASQDTSPPGPRSRQRAAVAGGGCLALAGILLLVLRPWGRGVEPTAARGGGAPVVSAPGPAKEQPPEPPVKPAVAPVATPMVTPAPPAVVQPSKPVAQAAPSTPVESKRKPAGKPARPSAPLARSSEVKAVGSKPALATDRPKPEVASDPIRAAGSNPSPPGAPTPAARRAPILKD